MLALRCLACRRAGSGKGRGLFSFPPEWKQMFLFIIETMQYMITQRRSVSIAEKERFYPSALVFDHPVIHTHTRRFPILPREFPLGPCLSNYLW